jgi:hypothetical protein
MLAGQAFVKVQELTPSPGTKDLSLWIWRGITLGGASVDSQGIWSGHWETVSGADVNSIAPQVPAASATILKFVPAG